MLASDEALVAGKESLVGGERLCFAALLGADPKSLAVRCQRALEKLRRELPGSIYAEFADG